jgi:Asp-tRNA(Asn)/Glu-tRNA(Gln) amidotransferase A subunit family amidase
LTPNRKRKQAERAHRIARLPAVYHAGITAEDKAIFNAPIEELVKDVQSSKTSPASIIRAYGKAAIKAHDLTNCLTEVMFPEAEAWAKSGEVNLNGPLAGIPISLKDSIQVGGFDTSVGYSRYTGMPAEEDGTLVKLLKEAGAIPFAKTNLPITLLSFESTNDVRVPTKISITY